MLRFQNTLTQIARQCLPPVAWKLARRLQGQLTGSGCVYLGEKWPAQPGAGWVANDVLLPRRRLFEAWRERLQQPAPLADEWPPAQRESIPTEGHNRYLCAAFVFALAARQRAVVSVLDWGGACADYLLLAERMVPQTVFEWHCVELPDICELGREVNPRSAFHADDSWSRRTYALVFSSSAILYVPVWRDIVRKLAEAADEWLYITRIPVVWSSESYVFLQRVPLYGTSYPGWALKYDELVRFLVEQGFKLQHEFQLGAWLPVRGSPEQPWVVGLLFRRSRTRDSRSA